MRHISRIFSIYFVCYVYFLRGTFATTASVIFAQLRFPLFGRRSAHLAAGVAYTSRPPRALLFAATSATFKVARPQPWSVSRDIEESPSVSRRGRASGTRVRPTNRISGVFRSMQIGPSRIISGPLTCRNFAASGFLRPIRQCY